jgi:hypothetical protein
MGARRQVRFAPFREAGRWSANGSNLAQQCQTLGRISLRMINRRYHPVLLLAFALAYIAVAVINRQYSWAWGREWLAPAMMYATLFAILGYFVFPRRAVCGRSCP